jgi:hypothetical protein
MRISDTGNLGLGVTPSAWGALFKALQFGGNSVLGGNNLILANNAFNNGTNWIYSTTNFASRYESNFNAAGTHAWFTAASGTAGNTISFTQAMTLDASGNLGVGTTSLAGRATFAGSGTLLTMLRSTDGVASRLGFDLTGVNYHWIEGASGGLRFATGDTERARITTVGNFSLGGTANRGTTVGTNALQIFNGTAPAGTLTNGVSLYSSSGDLFFMDAAGTASRVGFRGVPQSGSAKTGSYTLATTDVGDYIQVGSGGSITIPDATFATGDVVSIFNNTSGNITITCTITTAYIAGTDADKASVTLATRGVATILFISGTVCVISGNVS